MELFISMLRGINVSGHKKVPMPELKKLYEDLNYTNVQTYINSGNVLFLSNNPDSRILVKEIELAISRKYGFEVPVIIRTPAEMQNIVAANPFIEGPRRDKKYQYVTFLSDTPMKENMEQIMKYDFSPDMFIIENREAFLYCPGGYGNTKLTNIFFESRLKVTATTRNWNTVNELIKIALNYRKD